MRAGGAMPEPPPGSGETVTAQLPAHLDGMFAMYEELAAALPDEAFEERLPNIRSNSVGAQLWCVVGARESYARAIAAGEWSGFACSLGGDTAPVVRPALGTSAAAAREAVNGDLDDARADLALSLLEHEAQHAGQLLRYLFALDLEIPERWKTYFAL
jgi:hypothetical protein